MFCFTSCFLKNLRSIQHYDAESCNLSQLKQERSKRWRQDPWSCQLPILHSQSSHHTTSLFHPVPCMLLMLSRIHFPSSCSCVGKSACQASLCTEYWYWTLHRILPPKRVIRSLHHTQQLHILSHCPHTTVPYCSFCPYFQHFELSFASFMFSSQAS